MRSLSFHPSSDPSNPTFEQARSKRRHRNIALRGGALAVATLIATSCGSDDQLGAPVRLDQPPVTVAKVEPAPAAEVTTAAAAETTAAPAPAESAAPAADAASVATEAAPEIEVPKVEINPEVDPANDPLSTFALDVDTGSYTLARSYINGGTLPDPGLVRVEEFVNYFAQDYPQPAEGSSFGVTIDATAAPFIRPDQRIVRVGVQGRSVADSKRPDASLTFVIDVSGSMSDVNKLELVVPTLRQLLDNLRPTDRVAIVTYSGETQVTLPFTSVEDRAAIETALDNLPRGGSTYVEAGLRLGYEEARRGYDAERINRVILLSDGVANVGETGPDGMLSAIGDAARDGIDLVTVGFGMGSVNDPLMEQLADKGDGFYAYVDNEAEANRLFNQNLTGSLLTIARDAKAQIEFNPATVASYRLVGFENRAVADDAFRDDTVDGGELGAGHTVTAMYAITVKEAPPAGAEAWLARATMRWLDPTTSAPSEVIGELNAADVATSPADASDRLSQDVFVAAFADHLRGGPWAETLSAEALEQNISALAARVNDPALAELSELVRRWRELGGR